MVKAERLAARVGAVALSDFDELLDAGLDVITIGTPSATHAPLAIRALEAGLHVLCEKPIARTLADARRIVAAAERAAGILMVGHVCRYEPDHRRAKDSIEAGDLGTVRMVSHTMTTSVPGWSEVGWLADTEQSGGPLVDLGVHSFDFISWAAGSPAVGLQAVGADTHAGPATYVLATIRYANGAMGLVEASWAHPVSHGFKVSTEIIGTDGRVSWDYDQIAGGVIHFASRELGRVRPVERPRIPQRARRLHACRTHGCTLPGAGRRRPHGAANSPRRRRVGAHRREHRPDGVGSAVTDRPGVAILGCAHRPHAWSYARALASSPNARLAGVFDATPELGQSIADEFGVAYHDDARVLLESARVQAVVVCSATAEHRALVELAASRGRHVLCEKPIATTLEDAQAMIEACQRAGVQLHTAFVTRFLPLVQQVRATLLAGELR